jgi:hypothetical protein
MCMAKRFREIGRPEEALEHGQYVARRMGTYVESFALVLEEHVWSSLAIACSLRRALHTQRNHAERSCRAAGTVRERHGRKMGVGRGGDGNAADWSSLGDA